MSDKNLFEFGSFAKVAKAHPIQFFDIGARGGFDSDIWPIAFASDAVGFEPDPNAFELLVKQPDPIWKSTKILPVAIGGSCGVHTLYVPSDPQGASLLGPTERSGPARYKDQFFNIINTHQVETETMDDVLERFDISPPEYLKIDIEGPELTVLQNAPKSLANLLAIKVEVAFDTFRSGQPLASEVMTFLHESGFVLMDFIRPSHWRTHSNVAHPLMDKAPYYYSKGQLAHGNFVYFRRPEQMNDAQSKPVVRKIQLGIIAMGFGYFDFAADIFNDAEVKVNLDTLGGQNFMEEFVGHSKAFGRIEAKKAFLARLRGFGPHIRRVLDLIR